MKIKVPNESPQRIGEYAAVAYINCVHTDFLANGDRPLYTNTHAFTYMCIETTYLERNKIGVHKQNS